MAEPVHAGSLTGAELAEAKELDRRLCDAIGRKDANAFMACFWENPGLVAVIAGEVQRGPDAVRNGIQRMFQQNDSVRLEVNDVEYVRSGDGIIGVGTATFELKPPGGERRLLVERWSDFRRKVDGRMVYVLNHTTVVPE
jgi:ketosteroid isomerase-like protein